MPLESRNADGNTEKSLFELFRVDNAPQQKTVVKSTVSSDDGVVVNAPETEEEIVEDIF